MSEPMPCFITMHLLGQAHICSAQMSSRGAWQQPQQTLIAQKIGDRHSHVN